MCRSLGYSVINFARFLLEKFLICGMYLGTVNTIFESDYDLKTRILGGCAPSGLRVFLL